MNRFLIGSAIALALGTTSASAAPIHMDAGAPGAGVADARLWLAQGNSGKGNGGGNGKMKKQKANAGNGNGGGNGKARGNAGKGNGNGKPDMTGGPKAKGGDKAAQTAATGNGKNIKTRRAFTDEERTRYVERVVSTPAPDGRDMVRLLGASGLVLASPGLVIADTPEDELIGYANCPPGLAKKDPPCVPPGLARKGVTFDEWAGYDAEGYDELWRERRAEWRESRRIDDADPEILLLKSPEIERLFGLDPAPDGQRYALIDGLPVLLDDDDYNSFLVLNELAQVPELTDAVRIAPTAALTQPELIDLYRLPQPEDGQNYAVVNGQLLQLGDENYEILQLIRVARAVL